MARPPWVTRFAPSPTGLLHRGHGFAALAGRVLGARWWLRIEDLDRGRCRPAFADAIHADLAWLGLVPDAVVIQSDRLPAHRAALDRLRARGLLYACTCTRADIARAAAAPHAGEAHRYPGTCRGRRDPPADGRPFAWRLDLGATGLSMQQAWTDIAAGPQAGRADAAGDPVLARKDLPSSYHLACVLDDAAAAVTLVTRGADLAAATPLQRLLQQLLDCPEPHYWHHPLIPGADGRRLAKRDSGETLAALRAAGADPQRLRAEWQAMLAIAAGG